MRGATATPTVKKGEVVCDRCGAPMLPEVFYHMWHPEVPLLFWRCVGAGHISQTLPLPEELRTERTMKTPLIGDVKPPSY